MYFAFSTTSHTAHDSNCIFPCYSAKIGNVLPTAISCHTLYDYLDPGIQRLIEMGSENNITSAKGHHVCLIILLLQSSFTMRMNLLCVRTFLSCNMSRAVLSVPRILVEHPSSLPVNTGGKLPAKPNSATLSAYPLTNFRLPYHTSHRRVRFISRSLSECRIQRVLP